MEAINKPNLYYNNETDLIFGETPDFFGDQETFDKVAEALYNFTSDDVFKTMPEAYNKALDILRVKNASIYAEYEPSIRFELFMLLHDWVDELTEDMLAHRWEFDNLTAHEFVEAVNEPYKALELLDDLYVDNYIPRLVS